MKRWVALGVLCTLTACNEETTAVVDSVAPVATQVGERVVEVPTSGNGGSVCTWYGSDLSLSIQNGSSVSVPVPVMCNPNASDKGYPLPDEKRDPAQSISTPVLEAPVNQSFQK